MITAAPLPGWKDLTAGFSASSKDDAALAAPWRRVGDYPFWFSRSAWAMQAVIKWSKAVFGKEPPTVWIPDYFCNQSLGPIRETGAKLFFYPIGPDLQPDWEICRKVAEAEPPALFFLVHYFGYTSDAQAARRFCDRFGAVLVEDAAHVLKPFPGVGEEGDFVFYSPHKLLAVPDGAVLLARPGIKRFSGGEEAQAIQAMVEVAKKPDLSSPQPWLWIVKRTIQKIFPFNVQMGKIIPFEGDCAGSAVDMGNPSLSSFSRRLLWLAGSLLGDIAARRRANEAALRQLFSPRLGWRPYPTIIQAEAVPYTCIFLAERPDLAGSVYEWMNRRGCTVFSWPDLPPEVVADPMDHKVAIHLRRTLLAFPVHQSINLDRLTATYRKCLRGD